eukprot:scaffold195_cov359-Prasinococcus_capsulatus_cf.AAC.14
MLAGGVGAARDACPALPCAARGTARMRALTPSGACQRDGALRRSHAVLGGPRCKLHRSRPPLLPPAGNACFLQPYRGAAQRVGDGLRAKAGGGRRVLLHRRRRSAGEGRRRLRGGLQHARQAPARLAAGRVAHAQPPRQWQLHERHRQQQVVLPRRVHPAGPQAARALPAQRLPHRARAAAARAGRTRSA